MMKYPQESSAPVSITRTHIGLRVLYRLPNQSVLSEGEIAEVSPEGKFFRVDRHWLTNRTGAVLTVLPKNDKRRSAFEVLT